MKNRSKEHLCIYKSQNGLGHLTTGFYLHIIQYKLASEFTEEDLEFILFCGEIKGVNKEKGKVNINRLKNKVNI